MEPNRRHPLGMYAEQFAASDAKLRECFAAGIPVILSADGQTFRPERALPGDEPAPEA